MGKHVRVHVHVAQMGLRGAAKQPVCAALPLHTATWTGVEQPAPTNRSAPVCSAQPMRRT